MMQHFQNKDDAPNVALRTAHYTILKKYILKILSRVFVPRRFTPQIFKVCVKRSAVGTFCGTKKDNKSQMYSLNQNVLLLKHTLFQHD